MKSPNLHETKKLFYKKYLYKISLNNELNHIFRSEYQKSKNLAYARDKLDEFASNYRNGKPLVQTFFRTEREVPMNHYLDAKNLYLILKNQNGNFKVRVETGTSLSIYTSDDKLLDSITDRVQHTIDRIWRPGLREKHLLKHNTIIVDRPTEFPLRITLKDVKIPPDFANWLRANRDKSRIGDKALQCIDDNLHMGGFYLHVRDEKVLSIVHMLIGHAIRGVYKLLHMPPTIDK